MSAAECTWCRAVVVPDDGLRVAVSGPVGVAVSGPVGEGGSAVGEGGSAVGEGGSAVGEGGSAVPSAPGGEATASAPGGVMAFCRLEHVAAWESRGAGHDSAGPIGSGEPIAAAASDACAWCQRPLGDAPAVLVRHRGEHRIADAFCTVGHLGAWARAGGRWRPGGG